MRITTRFLHTEGDMVVIATTTTGAEGLSQVMELTPDITLVDISLPDISGLKVISYLRAVHPKLGIVATSIHNTESYVQAALIAGADAFVPKDVLQSSLPDTIRQVHSSYNKPGKDDELIRTFPVQEIPRLNIDVQD
jgi:DNA-binding NarL/FixJ family response regulator